MGITNKLRTNRRFMRIASYVYRLLCGGTVRLYGKHNRICVNGVFLRRCQIRIKGDSNVIFIEESIYRVSNLTISITGNNNVLRIGKDFGTDGLSFTMEDDNNQIVLGTGCHGGNASELAAIEGTRISVGDDCMLSANITMRTGDSHSILDKESRGRINPSRSIEIGNHVWVGNTVLIFKGCTIGSNSIVAGGSVVTGKVFQENCIIGGNPARVIKEGIDWTSERI